MGRIYLSQVLVKSAKKTEHVIGEKSPVIHAMGGWKWAEAASLIFVGAFVVLC